MTLTLRAIYRGRTIITANLITHAELKIQFLIIRLGRARVLGCNLVPFQLYITKPKEREKDNTCVCVCAARERVSITHEDTMGR